MKDDLKLHLKLNSNYALQLDLECPSCHAMQEVPLIDVHTGMSFVCTCGEEFPINATAFLPVQHELDELQHLLAKTITLPL